MYFYLPIIPSTISFTALYMHEKLSRSIKLTSLSSILNIPLENTSNFNQQTILLPELE